MLELLRELVELESPTGETEAIRERTAAELRGLGGDVAFDGEHVRAEFPGDDVPLLLLGHFDTVWPRGTLARLPWRVHDGRAYGPGVYDMKAGLVVMFEAIRRARTSRALRVLLTADEEIGSPTARDAIGRAAPGTAAALVVEPPTEDGNLKTARSGLGRFEIDVSGRAAHAAEPAEGASAVEEIARVILKLHAASNRARGVLLNVGVVAGGTRYNVVAAEAKALLDIRVPTYAERDRIDRLLHSLEPETPGTTIAVSGRWTRPPLERSEGSARLFARARRHGLELGLELRESSSIGGSDGNLAAAHGVPVLDGLGAQGGGAHADGEHVVVASLDLRAELLARILRDPGV